MRFQDTQREMREMASISLSLNDKTIVISRFIIGNGSLRKATK
jgi:hypothetical protein